MQRAERWKLAGYLVSCLAATGASGQALLPYATDFETEDGLAVATFSDDTVWTTIGSPQITAEDSASAQQSVWLPHCGFQRALKSSFSGPSESVVFVDFYLKPQAVAATNLPTTSSLGVSAQTGFVLNGPQGEVVARSGNGLGIGNWIEASSFHPLTDGVSTNWFRLTYRLDYTTKLWDLYVDEQMVLADLGFLDGSLSGFSHFALRSDGASLRFDFFSAGESNPLFTDQDLDGIPDAYELGHEMSINRNDRYEDIDRDSLDNLAEYLAGTAPDDPDSDDDGKSDGEEAAAGANPTVPDAYSLSTVPFFEGFESYATGPFAPSANWAIANNGIPVVQAGDSVEGTQALQLVATGEGVTLSNPFTAADFQTVWVDLWLKTSGFYERPTIAPGAAIAYYFNQYRRLMVFHGWGQGEGQWLALDHEPVSFGSWQRLTARLNYQRQTWSLWLNGIVVAQDLGFANPSPFFSRLRISTDAATSHSALDAVRVSDEEPAGLEAPWMHIPVTIPGESLPLDTPPPTIEPFLPFGPDFVLSSELLQQRTDTPDDLLPSSALVNLPQLIAGDPQMQGTWNVITREARSFLEAGGFGDIADENMPSYIYNLYPLLYRYSFIYHVTGDERLGSLLRVLMLDAARRPMEFWIHSELRDYDPAFPLGRLETAALTKSMALALHWAGNTLSETEREEVRQAILYRGLYSCMRWLEVEAPVKTNNFIPVIGGNSMVAAKVLGEPEALKKATEVTMTWLNLVETDGSYGEPIGYFQYAFTNFISGMMALGPQTMRETVTGTALAGSLNWALSYYSINGGKSKPYGTTRLNFGDDDYPGRPNQFIDYFLAYVFNQGVGIWRIENFFPSTYANDFDCFLLRLILSNETWPEPVSPGELSLPTTRAFENGVAIMRSGYTMTQDIVLGLRSGGASRVGYSHDQPNRNSIALMVDGEYLMVAPGRACYRSPLRPEWELQTANHNTITFGQEKQVTERQASIVGIETGPDADYLASEAAGLYANAPQSVLRSIVFVKDPGYYFVWDRVQTNVPESVEWQTSFNHFDGIGDLESLTDPLASSHLPMVTLLPADTPLGNVTEETFSGWSPSIVADTDCIIDTVTDSGNYFGHGADSNMLEFSRLSGETSAMALRAVNAFASTSLFTLSFTLYEPSDTSTAPLNIYIGKSVPASTNLAGYMRLNNGSIESKDGTGTGSGSYSLDTAHRFDIVFNSADTVASYDETGHTLSAQSFDVWVDGTLALEDAQLFTTSSTYTGEVSSVSFQYTGSSGANAVYFGEIGVFDGGMINGPIIDFSSRNHFIDLAGFWHYMRPKAGVELLVASTAPAQAVIDDGIMHAGYSYSPDDPNEGDWGSAVKLRVETMEPVSAVSFFSILLPVRQQDGINIPSGLMGARSQPDGMLLHFQDHDDFFQMDESTGQILFERQENDQISMQQNWQPNLPVSE